MKLNYQFNYKNRVYFGTNIKYDSIFKEPDSLKVCAICSAFNIEDQPGARAKIKNILNNVKFNWCRLEE